MQGGLATQLVCPVAPLVVNPAAQAAQPPEPADALKLLAPHAVQPVMMPLVQTTPEPSNPAGHASPATKYSAPCVQYELVLKAIVPVQPGVLETLPPTAVVKMMVIDERAFTVTPLPLTTASRAPDGDAPSKTRMTSVLEAMESRTRDPTGPSTYLHKQRTSSQLMRRECRGHLVLSIPQTANTALTTCTARSQHSKPRCS
jgi:hypothetical protein